MPNTVELDQSILMIIFLQLLPTLGFNVKIQKSNLMAFCFDFF